MGGGGGGGGGIYTCSGWCWSPFQLSATTRGRKISTPLPQTVVYLIPLCMVSKQRKKYGKEEDIFLIQSQSILFLAIENIFFSGKSKYKYRISFQSSVFKQVLFFFIKMSIIKLFQRETDKTIQNIYSTMEFCQY